MAFELSGFTELSGQNVAQHLLENPDSYTSDFHAAAFGLPELRTELTAAEQAVLDREQERRAVTAPAPGDDSVPIRIADNQVACGQDYNGVNKSDLTLNAQQLIEIDAAEHARAEAERDAVWEQIRDARAYTTAEIYAVQGSRRPREAATRLAHFAVQHTLRRAEAAPTPTLSETELDTVIIPTLQHMATPSLAEAVPDNTTRALVDWTELLKLSWNHLRPADSALIARRLEMGLALGGHAVGKYQQRRLAAIHEQSLLMPLAAVN